MIAVVLLFQFLLHVLGGAVIFYRHIGNGLPEVLVDFFLRDAAQGFVTGIHTDVLRLVETAEHADLRKLGYTCQQHKP